MTVSGYAREGLAIARPGEGGTGIPASRTRFEGLADQLARLTWCWPALLAPALGLYQLGRPELWRDELASWSFASRPVPGLIASARHTGATQLAYYLLLHGWIAAFGVSADAMRTLSVLAMAAAAACVAPVGRRRDPGPGPDQLDRPARSRPDGLRRLRPQPVLLPGLRGRRGLRRAAGASRRRRCLPGPEHQVSWLKIGDGRQYYLSRDMPNGVPAPRQLVVAQSAAQAGTRYPRPCRDPAACLGAEPRIWVVGSGRQLSPYQPSRPPRRPCCDRATG